MKYIPVYLNLLLVLSVSACAAPSSPPLTSTVTPAKLVTLSKPILSTNTLTPVPTIEFIDLKSIETVCNNFSGTQLFLIPAGSTIEELIENGASKCYENAAKRSGLQSQNRKTGLWNHIVHQNVHPSKALPEVQIYFDQITANLASLGISLTPTPTVGLITMNGIIFFDYNGSGEQEGDEPGISDIKICIDDFDSEYCTYTLEDGSFQIDDTTTGEHLLFFESPTDEPVTGFRFINISHGWVDIPAYKIHGIEVPEQHLPDTELIPIDQPIRINLGEVQKLDIGLMQGFLTLPFCNEDGQTFLKILGVDHNPRKGFVVDYKGTPFNPEWDSHTGWDYGLSKGTFILASMEGIVQLTLSDWGSLNIIVHHGMMVDKGWVETIYGHMDQFLLEADLNPLQQLPRGKPLYTKQRVYRGQIIGTSGTSGTQWPHLHYELHYGAINPPEPDDYLRSPFHKDPYGVLEKLEVNSSMERFSSWTKFNDPQNPY